MILALLVFVGAAALLVAVLLGRPQLTASPGGKVLAFAALFLLPALALVGGGQEHLSRATSTEFCLSCHVMEPYGKSLRVDSAEALPALHFQNRLVDRDHACYTCHTDYTLFGGVSAKMRGMKHLWVNTFGDIPEKIALYTPYQNRECLHCHAGMRAFEESELHVEIRADLWSNATSCLECHSVVHDIENVGSQPVWKGASLPGSAPEGGTP